MTRRREAPQNVRIENKSFTSRRSDHTTHLLHPPGQPRPWTCRARVTTQIWAAAGSGGRSLKSSPQVAPELQTLLWSWDWDILATFRTVLSLGGQGAELATRREPGERVSPNRAALPTGQRRGRRTSEEKAGAPTQEDGLAKGNASKSGLCRAGILRMEKKKSKKEANGRRYKITIPWLHFDHKKGTVQLLLYFICLLCMILKSNKAPFKDRSWKSNFFLLLALLNKLSWKEFFFFV